MFLINGTLLIAQNEQNISEINVDNITDEDDDYILPKNVYFIGINANFGVVEPSLNEDIKLRQNLGNNPNSVHISGIHFAFGANFEYRAFRRFGLLLGIQYYGMSLKVSDNNSDFFYLQYKQENNTVYYAKTKEIKELANFVGIPISIKYLAHSRRFFGINTLLNFDTYFKIYSKYNIQFANANMYSSEKDIIDSFKKPINLIYANFSPSVMFRIGKEDFVHGNIEFKFPVIPMTTANNFFLASSINLGFFISGSIIIPIKSKK